MGTWNPEVVSGLQPWTNKEPEVLANDLSRQAGSASDDV